MERIISAAQRRWNRLSSTALSLRVVCVLTAVIVLQTDAMATVRLCGGDGAAGNVTAVSGTTYEFPRNCSVATTLVLSEPLTLLHSAQPLANIGVIAEGTKNLHLLRIVSNVSTLWSTRLVLINITVAVRHATADTSSLGPPHSSGTDAGSSWRLMDVVAASMSNVTVRLDNVSIAAAGAVGAVPLAAQFGGILFARASGTAAGVNVSLSNVNIRGIASDSPLVVEAHGFLQNAEVFFQNVDMRINTTCRGSTVLVLRGEAGVSQIRIDVQDSHAEWRVSCSTSTCTDTQSSAARRYLGMFVVLSLGTISDAIFFHDVAFSMQRCTIASVVESLSPSDFALVSAYRVAVLTITSSGEVAQRADIFCTNIRIAISDVAVILRCSSFPALVSFYGMAVIADMTLSVDTAQLEQHAVLPLAPLWSGRFCTVIALDNMTLHNSSISLTKVASSQWMLSGDDVYDPSAEAAMNYSNVLTMSADLILLGRPAFGVRVHVSSCSLWADVRNGTMRSYFMPADDALAALRPFMGMMPLVSSVLSVSLVHVDPRSVSIQNLSIHVASMNVTAFVQFYFVQSSNAGAVAAVGLTSIQVDLLSIGTTILDSKLELSNIKLTVMQLQTDVVPAGGSPHPDAYNSVAAVMAQSLFDHFVAALRKVPILGVFTYAELATLAAIKVPVGGTQLRTSINIEGVVLSLPNTAAVASSVVVAFLFPCVAHIGGATTVVSSSMDELLPLTSKLVDGKGALFTWSNATLQDHTMTFRNLTTTPSVLNADRGSYLFLKNTTIQLTASTMRSGRSSGTSSGSSATTTGASLFAARTASSGIVIADESRVLLDQNTFEGLSSVFGVAADGGGTGGRILWVRSAADADAAMSQLVLGCNLWDGAAFPSTATVPVSSGNMDGGDPLIGVPRDARTLLASAADASSLSSSGSWSRNGRIVNCSGPLYRPTPSTTRSIDRPVVLDAPEIVLPVVSPNTALLTLSALDGGIGLIALGQSTCGPPALKKATSQTRFLLSPFFDFGGEASALGNVALVCALAALQLLGVRLHASFIANSCDGKDNRRGADPEQKLPGSTPSASSWLSFLSAPPPGRHRTPSSVADLVGHHHHLRPLQRATTAWHPSPSAVLLHFPNLSIVAATFLANGVVYYSTNLLSLGATGRVGGVGGVLCGVVGIGFVAGLIGLWWFVERGPSAAGNSTGSPATTNKKGSTELLRRLRFQRYSARVRTESAMIPTCLLPLGRWEPRDMRTTVGKLRGLIVDRPAQSVRCALLPVWVALSTNALLGIAGPESWWCPLQWGLLSLISGTAVVVILVLRPARIPAVNGIMGAMYSLQTAIYVASAFVQSRSGDVEAAVASLMALSTVYTLVGIVKVLHAVGAAVWERRHDPVPIAPQQHGDGMHKRSRRKESNDDATASSGPSSMREHLVRMKAESDAARERAEMLSVYCSPPSEAPLPDPRAGDDPARSEDDEVSMSWLAAHATDRSNHPMAVVHRRHCLSTIRRSKMPSREQPPRGSRLFDEDDDDADDGDVLRLPLHEAARRHALGRRFAAMVARSRSSQPATGTAFANGSGGAGLPEVSVLANLNELLMIIVETNTTLR